ncbi:MAG: hypothetical protein ACLPUO_24525 [Streptosporangiaceae bacterium]
MPKHRAQRRKASSGSGVVLSAATARRLGRRARSPFVSRWVRASLVTPWFAAGVGIVVAATFALQSPRQILSFGPPSYGRCGPGDCRTGERPAPGSLATGKAVGVHLKPARPAAAGRVADARRGPAGRREHQHHGGAVPAQNRARPPAATVTVRFQLLPGRPDGPPGQPGGAGQPGEGRPGQPGHHLPGQARGARRHPGQRGFAALITVQSSRKIGKWALSFMLPGARIGRVLGAGWEESASGDGGTATGQPWIWPHGDGHDAQIVILGTGRPGEPAECVFDGARCSFS